VSEETAPTARPVLDRLIQSPPVWTGEPGPQTHVVLSSRVRLARNLESLPFPTRCTPDQQQLVVNRVQNAVRWVDALAGAGYVDVTDLEDNDLSFLVERRLISRDLAAGGRRRGVLVGERESLSIMVNEEDHLRVQGVVSGFRLGEALDAVSRVDDALDRHLEFAFSPALGFLTSCPTNVGTGLRASVLVHLPALQLTGEVRRVMQGAAALGLAVRGFYGEGTEIMGNFVQVSNNVTLGRDEGTITNQMAERVHTIIAAEEKARDTVWSSARLQVEDKVYRAYGILRHARSLKAVEVLNLASAVRFGIALELPDLCPLPVLNEILLFAQPGHLARLAGRDLKPEERRELRARWVRRRFSAIPGNGA